MQTEVLNIIQPKKKIKKIIFFLVLILIGGGYGFYHYFYKAESPKLSYITTTATKRNITNTISATGTLNPLNEVQIGSQISGLITKLYVDTNDSVSKGQVLAKIDDQKITQELERNEARLKGAKAQLASLQSTLKDKKWQFERLNKLYKESKGKFPSYVDVQNAQVAYEIAEAEVLNKKASVEEIQSNIKTTKIDYDNTIITSPIDGVVLVRSIDVGQTVAASFSAPELFRVAQNLEEMKLVVKIAESDIGKIKVGQEVDFSVDAYPKHTFSAAVDKIDYGSSTTDNIVSYKVTINVKNENLLLRPGMSATANIKVAEIKDAISLPVSALYFSPKQNNSEVKPSLFSSSSRKWRKKDTPQDLKAIWILLGDQPQKQEITTGLSDGQYIQVEGLDPSAKVILEEKKD